MQIAGQNPLRSLWVHSASERVSGVWRQLKGKPVRSESLMITIEHVPKGGSLGIDNLESGHRFTQDSLRCRIFEGRREILGFPMLRSLRHEPMTGYIYAHGLLASRPLGKMIETHASLFRRLKTNGQVETFPRTLSEALNQMVRQDALAFRDDGDGWRFSGLTIGFNFDYKRLFPT